MVSHQIKNALRVLLRRKTISAIIIVSLTVGFTCIFLFSGFIFNEYSTDSFQRNKDFIVRMQSDDPWVEGDKMKYITFEAPEYIKNTFPEVIDYCHWSGQGYEEIKVNDKIFYKNINWSETDPSFFNIFSYNFLEGTQITSLSGSYDIVITEKMAHKFFGEENAIGNTIIVKRNGTETTFVVSAVVNQPGESHIKFDLLTSIEGKQPRGTDAYLLMKKGTDIKKLEDKINTYKTEIPFFWKGRTVNYYLNDLESINITKDIKIKVYTSLGIAAIILFIAFFNYINLYINVIFDRAKEIDVIRILGGSNISVLKKLGIEIAILIIVSLMFSGLVIKIALPAFNRINASNLQFGEFMHFNFLLTVIGVLVFLVVLSCFVILITLKKKYYSRNKHFEGILGGKKKKLSSLSTVQYAITILLIICTITLHRQVNFIRHKDIGLDRNVVEFRLPETYAEKTKILKEALLSSPLVDGVSICNASPVKEAAMIGYKYDDLGEQKEYTALLFSGDRDYLKTLHIEILEGNEFKPIASSNNNYCYINESMVKFFNMENPIGKLVPGTEKQIAGVLKNFHWTGLESTVPPTIVGMGDNGRNLLVKIKDGYLLEGYNQIKTICNKITKEYPIEYFSIGEMFNDKHKKYEMLFQFITFFCFISIILSSIGLIAFSQFSIQRKVKEIGIRKVNGAKISEILILINQKLIIWIFLGFIIASPIAGYIMNKWLQNFAFRIELTWWIFAASGTVTLLIALLTVSRQSWQAATNNPVEALRCE